MKGVMKIVSYPRRKVLGLIGLLSAGTMHNGIAQAVTVKATGQSEKAVFQVSDADPKKWSLVLNNVKNAQTDLGKENIAIEIVAYGPGIEMLKANAEVAKKVTEAVSSGVVVSACENTMRAAQLSRKDMNPQTSYVPSGVVQIIKLQKAGYSYVRP